MSQHTKEVAPNTSQAGCLALLVRLTWLMVGNGLLLFLALHIAQKRALSILDLAFWATVVGLILVRYFDITRLGGLTKDGEPASLQHWRRYVLVLLLVSGGLWVLAHRVLHYVV